jgi:Uma2 family endonuclease
MATARKTRPQLSSQEYLAGERISQTRHELVGGEARAMAGTTLLHGEIQTAFAAAIRRGLPTGCRAYEGNIKLWVQLPTDVEIFYPDIFVYCGQRNRLSYYLTDASLIVEILSESTEDYDRTGKFEAYKLVPSLQTYVLVNQQTMEVEVFRRANGWTMDKYGPSDTFTVDGVATTISVAEIYQDPAA